MKECSPFKFVIEKRTVMCFNDSALIKNEGEN
jgi:hypothetical protein